MWCKSTRGAPVAERGKRPPYAEIPAPAMAFVAQRCGYATAYVYAILRSFDNPRQPGRNPAEECVARGQDFVG